MPRTKKDIFGGAKPVADMSSMIDLVFLLLIFFMVASKMITYVKDENVEIPLASNSEAPSPLEAKGRIVINVYPDETIHVNDGRGNREITPREVQTMMAEAKAANPNAKLLVRADISVTHKTVREVINASARGGVTDIVFATFKD